MRGSAVVGDRRDEDVVGRGNLRRLSRADEPIEAERPAGKAMIGVGPGLLIFEVRAVGVVRLIGAPRVRDCLDRTRGRRRRNENGRQDLHGEPIHEPEHWAQYTASSLVCTELHYKFAAVLRGGLSGRSPQAIRLSERNLAALSGRLHGAFTVPPENWIQTRPRGPDMKLTATIDSQHQRALLTFRESPAREDWVRYVEAFRGARASEILVDCRRVGPLDARFIGRFVGWIAEASAEAVGTRWAVVADDGLSYGAARELALRADAHGIAIEAFTSAPAACRWLRGEAAIEAGIG